MKQKFDQKEPVLKFSNEPNESSEFLHDIIRRLGNRFICARPQSALSLQRASMDCRIIRFLSKHEPALFFSYRNLSESVTYTLHISGLRRITFEDKHLRNVLCDLTLEWWMVWLNPSVVSLLIISKDAEKLTYANHRMSLASSELDYLHWPLTACWKKPNGPSGCCSPTTCDLACCHIK